MPRAGRGERSGRRGAAPCAIRSGPAGHGRGVARRGDRAGLRLCGRAVARPIAPDLKTCQSTSLQKWSGSHPANEKCVPSGETRAGESSLPGFRAIALVERLVVSPACACPDSRARAAAAAGIGSMAIAAIFLRPRRQIQSLVRMSPIRISGLPPRRGLRLDGHFALHCGGPRSFEQAKDLIRIFHNDRDRPAPSLRAGSFPVRGASRRHSRFGCRGGRGGGRILHCHARRIRSGRRFCVNLGVPT